MTNAPDIAEQIAAVEWARVLLAAASPAYLRLNREDLEDLIARLEAAAETLGHLQFMRETLP